MKTEFYSKQPHYTCSLHIEAAPHEHKTAHAIALTLEAEGWQRVWMAPDYPDGTRTINMICAGTAGPFGAWTLAERQRNLAVARKALRYHGIRNVPVRRLPLADLL